MAKKDELKCTICGLNLLGDDGYVQFDCPKCLKVKIFRCSRCRRLSNPYICSCGFVGP